MIFNLKAFSDSFSSRARKLLLISLPCILSCGLLGACNGTAPGRISFEKKNNSDVKSEGSQKSGKGVKGEDEETETLGGSEGDSVESSNAFELKLKLSDAGDSDGYDYTFAAVKVELESDFKAPKTNIQRFVVSKKGSALSSSQKAFASRLCKDISLSASAKSLEAVKSGDEGLFIVWRTHFASDVKSFLVDYLAKEGESIACAALITQEENGKKASAYLVFNALSDKGDRLLGTSRVDEALKEGTLLLSDELPEALDERTLSLVSDAAKISMKVSALNANDVKLEAGAAGGETCYLVASGNTTKPYNPKSKSNSAYAVKSASEFIAGKPVEKAIGGRMIASCSKVKVEGKDSNFNVSLTCSDYFAAKDLGLEAGCAWDIPISNKGDAENAINLALTLEKFNVKTRDGSKIKEQTSESIIPISGINGVRDGQVNVSQFSKGQAQLIEDALDLWIAVGEETYRKNFYNHINKIYLDGPDCENGGGAWAYYGAKDFYWCTRGSMGEDLTTRRFQDPMSHIYRAVTAYHETKHTHHYDHDVDNPKLKPCEGTAASAEIAALIIKNCNFDYCKQAKGFAADVYKNELNYSYKGDNTGRKSQGDCKVWSNILGISGGGF